MPAAKVMLTIEQGATYNQTLLYFNPDGVTPINLTGVTAKMQIRPTAESSTLIIELSTTNGRIVIVPLEGKLTLSITDEDTNALPAGKYVYDLELYNPDGTTARFIEGKVTIHAAVTR